MQRRTFLHCAFHKSPDVSTTQSEIDWICKKSVLCSQWSVGYEKICRRIAGFFSVQKFDDQKRKKKLRRCLLSARRIENWTEKKRVQSMQWLIEPQRASRNPRFYNLDSPTAISPRLQISSQENDGGWRRRRASEDSSSSFAKGRWATKAWPSGGVLL